MASMVDIARAVLMALYYASLVGLLALGASYAVLVLQYFRLRRRGLARERALLAGRLPPDRELPSVLIQIPVLNEAAVIDRLLKAVGALDWPPARLVVQVIDQSDDETPKIAARGLARLRRRGIDARLVHKPDRVGFKAGALAYGLKRGEGEFIAVFDADYVPPPATLRQCMSVLLGEQSLAFVQARVDYLNAGQSLLTRGQAAVLDAHASVEQAAQSWSGWPFIFNGTCGVWRRRALEAAGGWQADTIVEDVDLSLRAYLEGWSGMFLTTVPVPGELPTSLGAWRGQQLRWAAGFAQVGRKHLWRILRSSLPWPRKIAASVQACRWSLFPLTALAILSAGAWVALEGTMLLVPTLCGLAVVAIGIGAYVASLWIGHRALRRTGPGRFVAATILVVVLYFVVIPLTVGWSTLLAALGARPAFVRTPKAGGGT